MERRSPLLGDLKDSHRNQNGGSESGLRLVRLFAFTLTRQSGLSVSGLTIPRHVMWDSVRKAMAFALVSTYWETSLQMGFGPKRRVDSEIFKCARVC